MQKNLSKREQQVYELICSYWSEQTCAPPMRWIAQQLGLNSRSYIHQLIHSLVAKNVLTIVPGKVRKY